jgi:hypothetical protein
MSALQRRKPRISPPPTRKRSWARISKVFGWGVLGILLIVLALAGVLTIGLKAGPLEIKQASVIPDHLCLPFFKKEEAVSKPLPLSKPSHHEGNKLGSFTVAGDTAGGTLLVHRVVSNAMVKDVQLAGSHNIGAWTHKCTEGSTETTPGCIGHHFVENDGAGNFSVWLWTNGGDAVDLTMTVIGTHPVGRCLVGHDPVDDVTVQ